jgi:hypothetical protein
MDGSARARHATRDDIWPETTPFVREYRIDTKLLDSMCAELTIRDSWTQHVEVVRINTKEKAIRDALIALGWTPPADPCDSDEPRT